MSVSLFVKSTAFILIILLLIQTMFDTRSIYRVLYIDIKQYNQANNLNYQNFNSNYN